MGLDCLIFAQNSFIMEKILGATERRDGIQQIGRRRWEVFYGFGMDGGTGYNYRQTFEYKPTAKEVRQLIIDTINANTEKKILNGFVWKGIRVYLSTENQTNFKAAFDLNMQMNGAMLPIKFKLGEDENGSAIYHIFEDMEDFSDFYTSAVAYINQCLNDGWEEKDSLDMTHYE
jgi:hypothetical protein